MKILIVEDDYYQSEWLNDEIKKHFPDISIEIIETELEFYNNLSKIEASPPDLILLDIMLSWTFPEPGMEKLDHNTAEDGFYNAGLRCQRLLSQKEKTRNIPIILYSVLDNADLSNQIKDLPNNVIHIAKNQDSAPVLDFIRKIKKT